MTTNLPAHGPVSLERLHQIREILSKAVAQSDGGNLGYAMADAVKVIDGAIAARKVEAIAERPPSRFLPECLKPEEISGQERTRRIAELMRWFDRYYNGKANPKWFKAHTAELCYYILSAATAPIAPEEMTACKAYDLLIEKGGVISPVDSFVYAWNACRAAMLQVGNSPVTPDCWIPVSDRMPERDIDVQVYCADKKEQMVGYLERNEAEGWFRFASLPNGGGVYCKPTHWMPLPAAPKQEVNRG